MVKKLNEYRNSKENALELAIIFYNKNEIDFFNKILSDNNIDYNLYDKLSLNFEESKYPLWVFIKVDNYKHIMSTDNLTSDYFIKNNLNKDNFIKDSLFDYVWEKPLDIRSDFNINLIIKIFKEKTIDIKTPDYKPKNINRILESKNINDFIKIAIMINSNEEGEKVQKILFDNGYLWHGDSDTQKKIIHFDDFPVILFAYIDDMSITMMEIIYGNTYCENKFNEIKNGIYTDTYYRLFDINSINDYKHMIKYKKESPSYNPKNINRTLESINNSNKYREICIKFNNIEEFNLFKKLTKKETTYDTDVHISSGLQIIFKNRLSFNDPIWSFIRLDNFDTLHMNEEPILSSSVFDGVWKKILNMNDDLSIILNSLKNRKIQESPSYNPKNIKRTLESFNSFNKKILYAFDLDNTLVYSDDFTKHVKPLVENFDPISIFNIERNKIDVDLSELNYEHGRIYIDDPKKEIIIPKNSSWVRKKDRIYLTTPESYYLTDESIPNKVNDKMINLYNSVENKAIITIRKESLRDRTLLSLRRLGIEEPNYGIYMFPDNNFSFKSKWKSEKLLELYNMGFDEINYYDDNIKLLKKMKKNLSKFNKKITLFKVSEFSYRKI